MTFDLAAYLIVCGLLVIALTVSERISATFRSRYHEELKSNLAALEVMDAIISTYASENRVLRTGLSHVVVWSELDDIERDAHLKDMIEIAETAYHSKAVEEEVTRGMILRAMWSARGATERPEGPPRPIPTPKPR